MASFKLMSSSNSRNSDLSRRNSSSSSSSPSFRSHHLRLDPHSDHSRLSFGYGGGNDVHNFTFASNPNPLDLDRSVDDVWKEIISGENKKKTVVKEEAQEEVLMTLEDFLAKVAADEEDSDVKIPPEKLNNNGYNTSFNYPMMVQNNNTQFQMSGEKRGKRGRLMMMDKDVAQRQKRMIKNRESAARSREKKQAYQLKLETLVATLEEENEQLLKEVEEMSKVRYKKLMEQLVPVEERPKQSSLSRNYSLEW